MSKDIETPGDLSRFLGYLRKEQIEWIDYSWRQAAKNDINPEKFWLLIWCESQFEPRGGDYSTTTKTYMSNGLLQFQKRTWNEFSDNYNFQGNYHNSKDQIDLATLAIKDGMYYHWKTCSKRSKLNLDYENPLLSKK